MLRAEGARKGSQVAQLNRLTATTGGETSDTAQLKRELLDRISDAKGLLGRQTSEARTILRNLITQPLQFHAFEKEGWPGYQVTGEGSYLALLPSPLVSPIVVSPTGFVLPRSNHSPLPSICWSRLHEPASLASCASSTLLSVPTVSDSLLMHGATR